MNYYNDLDQKACAWTRELIADKQIPDGIVDCRSITEIEHDLSQFTHCTNTRSETELCLAG